MATKSLSCPPSAAAKNLRQGALSLEEAREAVESSSFGALVSFEGRIRGEEAGRPIAAITYQAYEAMAEREISKILREAESRWPVRAVVRHRLGRVPVGEAAFLVACAGVHRREAFAACSYVVDQVKARAPIWKAAFS